MQNWDAMQPTANYDQHNSWYNSMFAANIKTEPGTTSPHLSQHQPASPLPSPTHTNLSQSTAAQLEHFLKHQHTHQQLDSLSTAAVMTPSPSQNDTLQHFFDTNMQQQLLQQQQYQQQFQQAQQAAAQNQVASAHLSLGFNPLTPPGLPNAILPAMPHFYQQPGMRTNSSAPQTPSPQPQLNPAQHLITPNDSISEKVTAALTPRHTPPMDITPPKSPSKAQAGTAAANANNNAANTSLASQDLQAEKDQDVMSNSSEDMKYMIESEDDESIRMPIYNSHGKMKNYKCKSCSMVAITKVAFWEHARSHMKPEKILQCPKCPFVTELKHHLEYHIRKHKNLKPFQCDKCSYSCVNKSMLNSHRKSHSSVYQYRCADCDYATKYCHSFKLHLRKYEHKPGMVLDEEGIPNPSVIIDVYGTRRGPKSKNGGGSGREGGSSSSKRGSGSERHSNANDLKLPATSQLSAALQGFPMPQQQQQQQPQQMSVSPAKSISSCSATSDLPQMTYNLTLQQQQQKQQQQAQQQQQQQAQQQQAQQQQAQQAQQQIANNNTNNAALPNLLPPLASILQQNRNMAPFFPYWNLNLQMLAAQQQAAVLAQLSPRMRETALQQMQQSSDGADSTHGGDDEDEDEDEEHDNKSVDSAMDLSQGTPTKDEEQQQTTPEFAINLKLECEPANETPLLSSMSASRRKGRVLKLDTLLQAKSASQSPEQQQQQQLLNAALQKQQQLKNNNNNNNNNNSEMPLASSPIGLSVAKIEDASASSADESMEVACPNVSGGVAAGNASANTSASSTASSSGNSSNSSNASATTAATAATATSSSSGNSSTANSPSAAGAIYECKYCDIYFKDAVLYTIHMGYHSCDDVFKCNMCGEKCDGPVGLFVHMARNAHS